MSGTTPLTTKGSGTDGTRTPTPTENTGSVTDDNGNEVTPPTRPPTEQESLNRFCEFRDSGVFAFPVNCQAYVHCDRSGRATFDACSPGQHFHQQTRTCVEATSFSCYDGFTEEGEGTMLIHF